MGDFTSVYNKSASVTHAAATLRKMGHKWASTTNVRVMARAVRILGIRLKRGMRSALPKYKEAVLDQVRPVGEWKRIFAKLVKHLQLLDARAKMKLLLELVSCLL